MGGMSNFKVGDRVAVREAYDEAFAILGMRAKPGTVVAVHGESIIVAEDGGTSAPYQAHELEHVRN
jgi:hypothetical protein